MTTMKQRMIRHTKKAIAIPLLTALALAGCGAKEEAPAAQSSASRSPAGSAAATATPLPQVELTWYYPVQKVQPDQQLVEDEVNKYLKEKTKLNATVKLKAYDFGSYTQKMNTAVAANESFDIIWTSSWNFNYLDNARKGAFLPIDEMVQKYAPKTYASMPKFFWDDAKAADGKIYAVPNVQIAAQVPGIMIQKRFVDKYKSQFDATKIKTFEDLEKFLEIIKKNEPGIIPFLTNGFFATDYFGIDNAAGTDTYSNDKTFKITDSMFTPEYKRYLDMAHNWYKKGYIAEEAVTAKSIGTVKAKGNYAVGWEWTIKPGGDVEVLKNNGNNPVIQIPFGRAFFTGITPTMNAISKTSKNPERAMMFLELVNNDKTLYNLLCLGIEGKHYDKVGDVVKVKSDSTYAPNVDWVFGNVFNSYLKEGVSPTVWEETKKLNETALVSPKFGFKFDAEPVKTEVANVNAVIAEYALLGSGAVDPAESLPKYQDALKKAGIEKITAEKQKQLDAFLKSKGAK